MIMIKGVNMKVKVFAVVGLLIVNNVAYAHQEVLVAKHNVKVVKAKKRQQTNVRNDIMKKLMDRGLEKDAAYNLTKSTENISEQNIIDLTQVLGDGITYDQVLEILANRVLHKNDIDFSNKNTLITIAQKLKGFNISSSMRNSLYQMVEDQAVYEAA